MTCPRIYTPFDRYPKPESDDMPQPIDVYLDIETLPAAAAAGVTFGTAPGWTPPPFEAPAFVPPNRKSPPANWKDLQKIACFEADEDARHARAIADAVRDHAAGTEAALTKATEASRAAVWDAWARGSLSPMSGRIACIGYAVGDAPADVITGSEVDQLRALADVFDLACQASHGCVRVVGHNIDGFDGPYLLIRAARHGVRNIAPYLRARSGKSWDAPTLDTLTAWPCGSQRGKAPGSASLDAIAAFIGIDRGNNPITGAGVLEAYMSGREADIIAHCRDDIEVLRQAHRWMQAAGMCL